MSCVWLFLAVEVRWVGERLPPRPKDKGWWLCWVGADVIANRRFDERRNLLMAVACRDRVEADEKYARIVKQVTIPSGTVAVTRITAKDYAALVREDADACKALNEQWAMPAYAGECLGRRAKR